MVKMELKLFRMAGTMNRAMGREIRKERANPHGQANRNISLNPTLTAIIKKERHNDMMKAIKMEKIMLKTLIFTFMTALL